MTQVTLNKGGSEERTVDINDVHIHDLWHIAEYLDDHNVRFGSGLKAGDAVRDVWHLAHDMKRHIAEEGSK